jgi:uncharacterized protein
MARFQSAEAFQAENNTLELLPLRFERARTHYLVSNMVGDFIRLSGDELNRLVDLRIHPGDGLYEKAYAAHLINGKLNVLKSNYWPCGFVAGWHFFAK